MDIFFSSYISEEGPQEITIKHIEKKTWCYIQLFSDIIINSLRWQSSIIEEI